MKNYTLLAQLMKQWKKQILVNKLILIGFQII